MKTSPKFRMKPLLSPTRLMLAACFPILLGACGSLTPVVHTPEEIRQRVQDDRVAMYSAQEPVLAPISFHEASARALKYNLDYRLKLMESALSRSSRCLNL